MRWSCLIASFLLASPIHARPIQIASKVVTESIILSEILVGLARQHSYPIHHQKALGGNILWSALRSGEIDMYPEYTGTLRREVLANKALPNDIALRQELAQQGIVMTAPLGFNNSYALAIRNDLAERLQLHKISDLKQHSALRFGFSNGFMDRGDGWPGLRQHYQLPQQNVRGMEHSLTYQALHQGDIDVLDAYTTDPHIGMYQLQILDDDLRYFPRYDAVILYRQSLTKEAPALIEAITLLTGRFSDQQILTMNQQVEIDGISEIDVAADYLRKNLGITAATAKQGLIDRLRQHTLEHLLLVSVSLGTAILVAVPLGILATKRRLIGHIILVIAEVIQTIPGLALLVLLAVIFVPLHLPTIGPWPMISTLFLYSLLPIIRNTQTGLTSIPKALRESSEALGLPLFARLRLIELPLAMPLILAGIKTTAVINVGYATLGGLIGAGGYGEPIMSGLRLHNNRLMLEGAIPAALMALLVKSIFAGMERWLVAKGLRDMHRGTNSE